MLAFRKRAPTNEEVWMFRIGLFLCTCLFCFGQELSLEKKVAQLMMVHFYGEEVNEDARVLVEEIGVGGIIYFTFSNGLHSFSQVSQLSRSLQNMAEIPLLIATDQEGGIVTRLQKEFTSFPGNRALAETKRVDLAERAAFAMGQELLSAGIVMNLAPVVDVNNNPRNPVIGVRSFGEDPETVVAFAEAALHGYKKAGVITTLKHFPGHGDVDVDSHHALPVVQKSKEEMQKMELVPFQRLSSEADVVMTAHLLAPALDPDHCVSLSKKALDVLRDELGFEGVIMTDSLVMNGVLEECSWRIEEAAIRSLEAGSDLLLFGGRTPLLELHVQDIRRIHQSIVEAVISGRLSEERIDQSFQKVLHLKKKVYQLKDQELSFETEGHSELAQEIASLALKEQQFGNRAFLLKEKKIALFAPDILKKDLEETSFLSLGKSLSPHFLGTQEEDFTSSKDADVLILFTYNAWKSPPQISWIESLFELEKPIILVVTRDPQDMDVLPKAELTFCTFNPSFLSLQAVCEALKTR